MDALPLYNCSSMRIADRLKKIRSMRPKAHAGNTVGDGDKYPSRRGGKIRGMKAGRQRAAKVNVASLVAQTKKMNKKRVA